MHFSLMEDLSKVYFVFQFAVIIYYLQLSLLLLLFVFHLFVLRLIACLCKQIGAYIWALFFFFLLLI